MKQITLFYKDSGINTEIFLNNETLKSLHKISPLDDDKTFISNFEKNIDIYETDKIKCISHIKESDN